MITRVVTDSTSYLPRNIRREYAIDVISMKVNIDGETFAEDGLDNETFYRKMAESKRFPTSSLPPVQEMYDLFERHVKAGEAVVAVFLSAKMSGTHDMALMVRDMILERYLGADIRVIDSKSNSMELGFAVLEAARAARAGKSPAEVAEAAKHVIGRSRFLFTPHELDYLRRSGRIGGAAALIGSVLQIRPVLTVTNGETAVVDKVRTNAKAIEVIVRTFLEDVKNKGLGEVVVHHINNELEGRRLAALLEKEIGQPVDVVPIGPVIGCHVGPGSVGIVYYTCDLRDRVSEPAAVSL